MGGNIHSLEFYKLMAFVYADNTRGNKNGKLDQKEEKYFNEFLSQFERDGKPGISEEDISLHTDEVVYTPEEAAALATMDELNNLSFKRPLTDEEKARLKEADDKFFEMMERQKVHDVDSFSAKVSQTIEYLKKLSDDGKLEQMEIAGQKLNLNIDDINAYKRALEEEYNIKING